MTRRSTAAILLIALAPWTAPLAVGLRVGADASCDYADLDSALTSIEGEVGTHYIRINKGNYAVPDSMVYVPTVNQTAVYLEGGYDTCTATTPSGNTANDADRAVFDGTGGVSGSVLRLVTDGRVGSFQIRRIVLKNGELKLAA